MKQKFFYRVIIAGSTATMIAGPVIIMLCIGLWLDGLFMTSPIFAFAGGMVGFIGSIMSLMKFLNAMK